MDWNDDAVILSKTPYGESSSILTVMSENHGKWAGFVKGASGRRTRFAFRAVFECGDIVQCRWRSRISDNLGNMTIETKLQPFILAHASKHRLLAIKSVCELCLSLCPERQAIKDIYDQLTKFLRNIAKPDWILRYIRFELGLMQHTGYGLSLNKCAVTGVSDGLVYVSPKTGHAVCQSVGEPYKDKLLKLPGFLAVSGDNHIVTWQDVFEGLDLIDFFLQKVLSGYSKSVPRARVMLLQALTKDCKNTGASAVSNMDA
ncbi:MAG: DNA repair protein RecO [Holosporales bacterium]|jgi:DNA repair protein RecO (recombination protein O)|nr:DNA repair protein RecO [Holosporales bacterium]